MSVLRFTTKTILHIFLEILNWDTTTTYIFGREYSTTAYAFSLKDWSENIHLHCLYIAHLFQHYSFCSFLKAIRANCHSCQRPAEPWSFGEGKRHADHCLHCALLQRQGRSLEFYQGGLLTIKAALQNTAGLSFSYCIIDVKWILKLYI